MIRIGEQGRLIVDEFDFAGGFEASGVDRTAQERRGDIGIFQKRGQ